MDQTVLSHHFRRQRQPGVLIRDWPLYIASLTAPKGPLLLLEALTDLALKERVIHPHQARLAELLHVSPRTIIRYTKCLRERGWLRVIRRGKKLTNLYRLGRALWERITGRVKPRIPKEWRDAWNQLGLKLGVKMDRVIAAGVGPPGGGGT